MIARVRMTHLTSSAYGAAIRAFIECCNKDNGGNFCETLKGVIVDWSSAQINGIKFAFGDERGEELLRGCQVYGTDNIIMLFDYV